MKFLLYFSFLILTFFFKIEQNTNTKRENLVDEPFLVRYTPKFQEPLDFMTYSGQDSSESVEIFQKSEQQRSLNYFTKFCNHRNHSIVLNSNNLTNLQQANKIVLVVTFNHEPREENILLLKHAYASYFQNIVVCGVNAHKYMNKFRLKYAKEFDSFTLIDSGPIVDGYLHYHCMARVYEMNFKTAGLLLMSDDVLLKYWKLDKLNLEKIWYPFELNCSLVMPDSIDKVTKECEFEGKNFSH